ncbi:MAG: ABC transporter permease [Planctomycetes bacterium]|nr:ABC transporter permease [Planctomycetota bacterium]
MISIGWRNLKREPTRMVVAVFGVVFAVVLVTVEVGMLLGLVQNASLLIDRSKADIWVSTVDVKTFDFATPIDARKKDLIQAVPGVQSVEEYNVSYSVWKLPDGGNANIQVIAFDLSGNMACDLPLVEGSIENLHNQDAVIIDEGERAKLGNPHIGDFIEIMQRRAKIVGFTRGMRSFTTTPYVFTSLRRGETYGWLTTSPITSKDTSGRVIGGKSIYFLVKVADGYDVDEVRAGIVSRVSDIEANTRESFAWRTRIYWLIETGVGIGFLAAALLGLLVGGVIVSQTLYAMTVEKVPEFGVLKALGAGMDELARVVLEQGMICGVLGLLLGLAVSFAAAFAASSTGTTVLVPWPLVVFVSLLTAALCSGASLVSILRLRRVEPAMVFRV